MRAVRFTRIVDAVMAQSPRATALSILGSFALSLPPETGKYVPLSVVRSALGDAISDRVSKYAEEVLDDP
jgi:hypothetical protein